MGSRCRCESKSLSVHDILAAFSAFAEIFVLGCGARIQRVPEETRAFLRSRRVMLEAVDTVSPIHTLMRHACGPCLIVSRAHLVGGQVNACQIFNVLNQEGRVVMGGIMALAPPE